MKVSKTGYKKNSKDKKEPSLLIPSNQITMKGVEFPVLGTDNTGYSQMMYPGSDYSFPGSYVYELPMAQDGGYILPGRYRNPEGNWVSKYAGGGWLDKYQDGSEVTPGMRPSGQKRSDYVPYKDVTGSPYETQDPYINNYSTVDTPENLSELPSYRLYTMGKGSYKPFSPDWNSGLNLNDMGYVKFDPKTGYNYQPNRNNLQDYQSLPMQGEKEFNLRRFVLNPYEGQPQTHDAYIKNDGTVDKENFIPTSYSREETMDNVFKDLYGQNLYKFKGDRDAAYNATSEFMKERVEPQYRGKYYEYMNNPNVSAEDKLNINLKGSHMTVNPEQTEDYVRQTITNKLIEEHPEYMEKDESGNYKMSDDDFSNLVKADPRYKEKLNEYNDILQDWYVSNKNMSQEEAKGLVEKDLYKNVPKRKTTYATFKHGGWLDKYQSDDTQAQVKTYASDPNYFNNRAVFVDNPKANELVRSKVYAGTHGWDPNSNSLVKLNKPVAVPEAVREMSTEDWGKKSSKERFESNTPAGKEVRKSAVAQGMKDMVQNPLLYAPGAVAAGVIAAPVIAGATPAISGALSAPFTYGSTVLPGVTAAGILDAAGATLATQQLLDPTSMTRQSVSRASENPTAGNVLAAVGEVGLTGLDYLGLGIGSEVFQGARRVGNKFLNSNLGQALTPFSKRNIRETLEQDRSRGKEIWTKDYYDLSGQKDELKGEIFRKELNPAFREYLQTKPFTAGYGNKTSMDALINRVRTELKTQDLATAKNFEIDNGDLVTGNKSPFFANNASGSSVLSSGSKSIIDLKTGKRINSEVTPSGTKSRVQLSTDANSNKVVNILDESSDLPKISDQYLNTLQSNIQHIEETVPGAKVFGSSRGVAEGNLPHLSSDYDVLITESDYAKNVKDKYPEKGVVGSAHKHDISGNQNNRSDDYVLDFNIIHENPDGTTRPVWIQTGLNQKSSREVELFRQAFPEEFFEASKQSIRTGKPLKINKTPKELIEKLDPTVKGIMDAYESQKPKHINRIDAYINYGNTDKVANAQDSFVKSIAGPRASIGHQFDASAFSNINDNKNLLEEIEFVGDINLVAKDPKRMQLALNDFYINSTVLSRTVQHNDKNKGVVETFFKKWNAKDPGGSLSGAGMNHVELGSPNHGGGIDPSYISGNKQLGLKLDTSNVNNYIKSIKKQTDGSVVLDKDELETISRLLDESFGKGFSEKVKNAIPQDKWTMDELINLHNNQFADIVFAGPDGKFSNDHTKYDNFNKAIEQSLGIRSVKGRSYGNSKFVATLGDFNEKLDTLAFSLSQNMPDLKSVTQRKENYNFISNAIGNVKNIEKTVNSENFRKIEGYVKGGYTRASERLEMLAKEKQMLEAETERIRDLYSKGKLTQIKELERKIQLLEDESRGLNVKRDQLEKSLQSISEIRKQLAVLTATAGFFGGAGYLVNTGQIGTTEDSQEVKEFYNNYLNTAADIIGVETQPDSLRTPKKKYGGWLDKYQDGKEVNKPVSATWSDEFGTYMLPEVTVKPSISPEATRAILNREAGMSISGAPSAVDRRVAQTQYMLSNPLDALGHYSRYGYVPQGNLGNYDMMEKSSPVGQLLMGFNPYNWANAAYRAAIRGGDPDTYTTVPGAINMGADIAEALPVISELGPLLKGVKSATGEVGKYLTTQTPLKNTYKYNPWAFKVNEDNWYRQVGQSAIDDALATGLIREAGEEVSPRMWGEFQDQIKRLSGEGIEDSYEKMKQSVLASRRPASPFFAKGELFYPMGRKPTTTKTGKISKNPAGKGSSDYLIETSLPNESFQPAYVKGMDLGVPQEIGSTAILKPDPSLRDLQNFKLYKQDWLQGYKQINKSKQLPGSPKKQKDGGWLDKYQTKGEVTPPANLPWINGARIPQKQSVEQQVNAWLGEPMKRAAEEAERRAEQGEDAGDSFRHSNAGRLTREELEKKFPELMLYTGIPQVASFLGATALGIGHEVVAPNRSSDYSWWDTAREAGEDIINNTIGATGLFSEEDLYDMYLNNQLPDGYGKGNMYFKQKKGGEMSPSMGYFNYIGGYRGMLP